MIRLGHCQIKVPVQLLAICIVVGMNHSCFCNIGNGITFLDQFSRKYHIFIENGVLYETSQLFVNASAVHRTDIRTEKRFDPQTV